jgi:hypothetical protein
MWGARAGGFASRRSYTTIKDMTGPHKVIMIL